MPNHIHHICLTVSNVKKSTEFYKKVLGWKVINQEKTFSELAPKKSNPDFMLFLGLPRDVKKPKSKFNRNNIGLDHFAFISRNMKELKTIEKRLKRLKIEMEDNGITDDGFGGTAIFTQDPDGMKVEWHLK